MSKSFRYVKEFEFAIGGSVKSPRKCGATSNLPGARIGTFNHESDAPMKTGGCATKAKTNKETYKGGAGRKGRK